MQKHTTERSTLAFLSKEKTKPHCSEEQNQNIVSHCTDVDIIAFCSALIQFLSFKVECSGVVYIVYAVEGMVRMV